MIMSNNYGNSSITIGQPIDFFASMMYNIIMITSEVNYANHYRRNKTTCRTSCYSGD